MMSSLQSYGDSYRCATVFVHCFKEKAVEFIAEHCDLNKVHEQIQRCCSAEGLDFWSIMSSEINTRVPASAYSRSPPESRRKSSSPLSPQSKRIYPAGIQSPAEYQLPPSPALTTSTVKSQPKPPADIIIIFDVQQQPHPLRMRPASVHYSFIREDIVQERLRIPAQPCNSPTGCVSVQYKDVPDSKLTAFHQVKLTWHPRHVNRTLWTRFYLVPNLIDVDVLLGDRDFSEVVRLTNALGGQQLERDNGTGAYPTEPECPVPQRLNAQGLPFQRPYAAPSQSYMDMLGSPLHGQFSLQEEQGYSRIPEYFRSMDARQHSPSSSVMPSASASCSNAPEMSNIEESQLRSKSTTSSTSNLSYATQLSDEVRVMYIRDNSRVSGSLDLNASGETFVASLQRIFRRIPLTLDRSNHFLRFMPDIGTVGANNLILALSESDLQHDWDETVKWIKANRKSRAPHLHAVIDQDPGG